MGLVEVPSFGTSPVHSLSGTAAHGDQGWERIKARRLKPTPLATPGHKRTPPERASAGGEVVAAERLAPMSGGFAPADYRLKAQSRDVIASLPNLNGQC
jgi:hypothetical protein